MDLSTYTTTFSQAWDISKQTGLCVYVINKVHCDLCVCMCVCVCVHASVCACVCVHVYALRIVSRDKILRFTNTFIIIIS